MRGTHEALKTIRFEGELLPKWAQLLDLAARLTPVSRETRDWFSKFTQSGGVDDARTVMRHCETLRTNLREHRENVSAALVPTAANSNPATVLAAWLYTLDTMIQQAEGMKTCAWCIDAETSERDFGGGDVTLRRI